MNKKYLILNLICASMLVFANNVATVNFNKITGSTPIYTADNINKLLSNTSDNFNKLLSDTNISFGSENINVATDKSTLVGHNNYIDMTGSGIFGDDSLISNIVPIKRTFDENGNWIPAHWGNYSIGSYNTNIVGDTVFQFGKFLEHYNGNRNFMLGHRLVCTNSSVNIMIGFQNNKGVNLISGSENGKAYENIMITTTNGKIVDSVGAISIGSHNTTSNAKNSVAIGTGATVKDSSGSIAIGSGAVVSNANFSIQIGPGTNTEKETVKIRGCVVVRDNKIPLDSIENADQIKAALGIQTISRSALPQKLSNNASNQEIIDTLNTIIEILNSDLQGTRAPE